ncbi:MAG: hypothetical protein HKN08_00230 [Gammaproteobacteria bacterium]|nr:hypothetical protein [Gammaproteobacteria bacterium]
MTEDIQQNEVDFEAEKLRIHNDLATLFGEDIVEQAELIDIADLNISDKMTGCISDGVVQLKKMKGKIESQRNLIEKLSQGEKLVLCMWILEMEILDKIQI